MKANLCGSFVHGSNWVCADSGINISVLREFTCWLNLCSVEERVHVLRACCKFVDSFLAWQL